MAEAHLHLGYLKHHPGLSFKSLGAPVVGCDHCEFGGRRPNEDSGYSDGELAPVTFCMRDFFTFPADMNVRTRTDSRCGLGLSWIDNCQACVYFREDDSILDYVAGVCNACGVNSLIYNGDYKTIPFSCPLEHVDKPRRSLIKFLFGWIAYIQTIIVIKRSAAKDKEAEKFRA